MMSFKTIALLLLSLFILFAAPAIVNAQPPNEGIEFNEGLTIIGNDFELHPRGENKTVHFHVFDTLTGVLIPDNESTCHYHLYKVAPDYIDIYGNGDEDFTTDSYGVSLEINGSLLNETGEYALNLRCNTTRLISGDTVEQGGFTRYDFQVKDNIPVSTRDQGIIWTCPADWTFPIVYFVITLLVFVAAFTFNTPLFGVFGSIMLVFGYLYIGACSPIMLSPILIIGLLLAIRFAGSGDDR